MFDAWIFFNTIDGPLLDINKIVTITILLVLLIRLLLKNAPKKYSYYLWFIVIIRMIFPISIQSIFSIYNFEKIITPNIKNETINQIITITQPQYYMNAINANEAIDRYIEIPGYNMLDVEVLSIGLLYLFVILAFIAYSIGSYIQVKKEIKTAIKLKDNIYQCENISSPFVIGYLKPKIIIPYNLDEQSQKIIIEHEKLHIKRKDYIIRILFYLLAIVYWMNPFVWLAYRLFIKDMEMSCDEYVVSNHKENNKTYSYTLLSVSSNQRFSMPRPLAFGESSIKQRVKNILRWKQPNKSTMILSICLCIYCLLAFTTDPTNQKNLNDLLEDYSITNIQQINIENKFLNTNEPICNIELKSWLHLKDLILVFDYVEVSEQTIDTSNNEIDSTYTIIGENNEQVVVKFTKDYTECIVESDEISKSYRIKNNEFAYENLCYGGFYYHLTFEPKNNFDHYTYSEHISLKEKNSDRYFNESYSFIQVKQTTHDTNYYSIKCDFKVDEDKITFISREDENIFVFDILKTDNKYQLKINEAESKIIYEDLLERLKLLEFEEKY